ncbi:RIR1 reductase, partial [Erythrocercus mccallii]|nr:RIR1 reductase [Erythrocercus mccallii]
MPTASTAQILGNNESIEPYTSNIYTRRVLSGEFQVSSLLFPDGFWLRKTLTPGGSVQLDVCVPPGDLEHWVLQECSSVLRGVCQLGKGVKQVEFWRLELAKTPLETRGGCSCLGELGASPEPCCPQGLKTGMYYLRTKPAANPIQFTLDKEKLREREKVSREEEEKERNKAAMVCSLENREECLMCGS